MKKTGKVLIGALSVTALIGTGFGAWVINNEYNFKHEETIEASVDTEIVNKYNSTDVNITKTDENLRFASKDNGQDLSIGFNLKATNEAVYGASFNGVADEYIPDITVSVSIDSENTDVNEAKKYIVLPETTTISYSTWLAESLKTKGYDLTLNFAWNIDSKYADPQEYANSLESASAQEAYFKGLLSALTGIKFKVTFEVGRLATMYSLSVAEVSNGAVTLKDNKGNTLSNKQYKEGTEVVVEALANANYKVGEVKANETVLSGEVYTFTLNKDTVVSASFVNKEVSFKVSGSHATVKVVDENEKEISKANAGSKFKVVSEAEAGYTVSSTKVKIGNEVLVESEGYYTIGDVEGEVEISVIAEATAKGSVSFEADASKYSYTLKNGEEDYTLGNEIFIDSVLSLVVTPVDGYNVSKVTFNGKEISAVEGVYSLTIVEGENTLSVDVVALYSVTIPESVSNATVTYYSDENKTALNLKSGDKFAEGTDIYFEVSVVDGYVLNSVKNNEVEISALTSGLYKVSVTKEGVNLAFDVDVNYDNIGELVAGESAVVKGKVIAKPTSSKAIIQDNTGFIEAYGSNKSINVGDVVKVSGTAKVYYTTFEIASAKFEVLEEELTLEDLTAEELTYENLVTMMESGVQDKTAIANKYLSFTFRAVKSGSYIDGYLLNESSDYKLRIYAGSNTLEDGKYYKASGYAFESNQSEKYLAVYLDKAVEEFTPTITSVAINTINNGENLVVNGNYELSATITPSYIIVTPTYEVVSGDSVNIEGSTLTAVKAGTAKIKASYNGVLSEVVEVTVEQVSLTAITLSVDSTSVAAGESAQLSCTYTPSDYVGTPTYEITEGSEYATVDENGKVTGVAEGTIKVVAKIGEIKSNEVSISITAAVVKTTTTITAEALGVTGSYANSSSVKSVGELNLQYKQLMKDGSGNIQTRVNTKGNSTIYNSQVSDDEGNDITKNLYQIKFTLFSAVSKNLTLSYAFSDSEITSLPSDASKLAITSDSLEYTINVPQSKGYKYFYLERTGTSSAIYFSSIEVVTF